MKTRRIDTAFTGPTARRPGISLAFALLGATVLASVGAAACTGDDAPGTPTRGELPPLPPREAPAADADGVPPAGEVRPSRELTIALSGEVRGELEPCGCPTLPYGGFARRSTLLDRVPRFGPLFQLDAGELLVKGTTTFRGDRAERAALVLDLSAQVGVDAWVPGPSDLLVVGIDELRRRSAPAPLSATWTDADGALLLPPSTVLERDGVRLGVVGISAPPDGADRDDAPVRARDPVAAATEAVAGLPEDLDLVVILGNMRDVDADRLAREVDGIAAVLTTPGDGYDAPRVVDGVPVIEVADRGRYLQLVTTRLGSTPDQPLALAPPAEAWRSLVNARRKDGSDPAAADLATASAPLDALAPGRNLAWVESRPLGEDLDAPAPAVDPLLAGFKQESLADAAARAAAAPAETEAGYATAAGCTSCHLEEFSRWTFTDHAKAWQSLVQRDAVTNVECVPCHVTGWGEPGGMGALDDGAVRRFKAVQCEGCHGPMEGHPDDPRVTPHPITAESCTGCHDEANSPDFDFATYLPRATCQGGGPDIKPL